MKKLNKKYLTVIKQCFIALLALVGFSSCDDSNMCKYGTPYATIDVKGVVKNTFDEPIKGIKIKCADSYHNLDSTYTDESGSYRINLETFPPANNLLTIYAEDADGTENGLYQNDTVQVTLDYNDNDSWYAGQANVVQDFILKEIIEEDSVEQ